MKKYQLIPKKDFIRSIKDILEKKNVEKRLIYLKSFFTIKDDFTPSSFVRMSWHKGESDSDLIKTIANDQVTIFQKKAAKVFVEVDDACNESGLYSILPCNIADSDQLQDIVTLLENKSYKSIYIAIEFNKERLSMSMNSSISMNSSMLDADAWTPAKEKVVKDRITREYEEKLEKQDHDFQNILQETIDRLSAEKEEIRHRLEQEIATGKNINDHQQKEITSLNTQIVNLNNQINRLNDSITTKQNDITNLNNQITTENTRANGLSSQISTLNNQLISERNRVSSLNSQLISEQNRVQSLNSQIATLNNNANSRSVTISTQDVRLDGHNYVRISSSVPINLEASNSSLGSVAAQSVIIGATPKSVTSNYFDVASR